MGCQAGRVVLKLRRGGGCWTAALQTHPLDTWSEVLHPSIPSTDQRWLCSPALTHQVGLGSAAGCTKRVQPGGISFRSLMMEKYLLGAAASSLLPAGAGLGTASIDFDSRSMEISSGKARGGRRPCDKEPSSACSSAGSHPGICFRDLISVPSCCAVPGVPGGCVPSLLCVAAQRRGRCAAGAVGLVLRHAGRGDVGFSLAPLLKSNSPSLLSSIP